MVDEEILIVEASNGIELLDLIDKNSFENTPALIVLDMNMPVLNGLETFDLI